MPKGYIIGNITLKDAEAYKPYSLRNDELVARYGGQFLVRGGTAEIVEGEGRPRHVVIEFPTYEAAKAAYNDPEYQKVAEIRRRTAASTIILVEGT